MISIARKLCDISSAQRNKHLFLQSIVRRHISNAELSNVLRPFYFAVHPDLFNQHPEQRRTNEESLKHISAFIETLQKQRASSSAPKYLNFYIRDKNSRDHFKLIKIRLERHDDMKQFIRDVLKACSLSTETIDQIKFSPRKRNQEQKYTYEDTSEGTGNTGGSIFDEYEIYYRNIQKKKQEKTLHKWIKANLDIAHERSKALEGIRDEVKKLEKSLTERLRLANIEYDCGWNIEHIRGCLKSLDRISNMHEEEMKMLKGRTIVFAQASGVSMEGHVMLFTGDVQHSWLDFIRTIPRQDEYLQKVPDYERALSQVLLDICVTRRKFMPKAQVVHYASHLCKVMTSMLDYLSKHSSYPESWPTSLNKFEIVIESEAGPLMVSPTGQFIAPASCSGWILVDFLSSHMDEARAKSELYQKNKHVEQDLIEKCTEKLKLKQLTKDDSVDPTKMIECLTRLFDSQIELSDCVLHITNYFSVLSDGTVCIPWDWRSD